MDTREAEDETKYSKAAGKENPSDALTKGVEAPALEKHIRTRMCRMRKGRHPLAPQLPTDEGEDKKTPEKEKGDREGETNGTDRRHVRWSGEEVTKKTEWRRRRCRSNKEGTKATKVKKQYLCDRGNIDSMIFV